ncbi:HCL423Cp [Eremothecium sinecaudum]|uniref:phosphatidylinositol-3,4,5-trisphosphate 3-phosphatase n=1 Tax=Eremothecium sinecaudum TaxID=45286 RepID=A0A109UY69_9SACH|nr:HCL423Cp [Eremothecium sinecaudum]AMD19728.1 HCL423Cp [Eremothecium sinecaudum]
MSLPKFTPENIIKSIYSTPVNRHKNSLGLVLDLTYISNKLIVCSYPVTKYPRMFYRNSLKDLVVFLNFHHGVGNWKIFNLKVEVCDADYTDEDIEALIDGVPLKSSADSFRSRSNPTTLQSLTLLKHSIPFGMDKSFATPLSAPVAKKRHRRDLVVRRGWLDHFPPPFTLLQEIVDEIHDYLSLDSARVAVIHCKMGKGRSGTVTIAYLMKYRQIPMIESCHLFMSTRFKPGISRGVTIYSQLRYLRYHETFICYDATQRPQIIEQLKKSAFTITSLEFTNALGTITRDIIGAACIIEIKIQKYTPGNDGLIDLFCIECDDDEEIVNYIDGKCIVTPNTIIDTSDMRISFGLRSRTTEFINSVTKLTSTAYCWLNLFWETVSCSRSLSSTSFMIDELQAEIGSSIGQPSFTIKWEDLDGAKGTMNKGLRLFDSLTLHWNICSESNQATTEAGN